MVFLRKSQLVGGSSSGTIDKEELLESAWWSLVGLLQVYSQRFLGNNQGQRRLIRFYKKARNWSCYVLTDA